MSKEEYQTLADEMQYGNYSVLGYNEISDEISRFLENINSNESLRDKSTVSTLSEYSIRIDSIIKELKLLKSFFGKKGKKRFIKVLGLSAITIFMPIISGGILALGSLYSLQKYLNDTKHIRRLIAEYENSNDKIIEYTPAIAGYNAQYIHNRNLVNGNYTEIIELISALAKEKQAAYLQKLKEIYAKNKNNTWDLYLATKDLKQEIFSASRDKDVDSNFIITNLLNYLQNLEHLDPYLLNNIIFHIYNLADYEDQRRFILELIAICVEKIKNIVIEALNNPNSNIVGIIQVELNKIPSDFLIMNIEAYLDELLKNNSDYAKLKQEKHSKLQNTPDDISVFSDFICASIILYSKEYQATLAPQ